MITIIARNSGHQLTHAKALEQGLQKIGVPFQRATGPTNRAQYDTVACWGWRGGRLYHAAGARVLVMERGYVGDRFAWTSLGWNGLNGHATFPVAPDDGGERFERNHGHLLQPWREGGDYVLIVGQVPGDAALGGKDLYPWYTQQAKLAADCFRLPVMFRPHPLAAQRQPVRDVPGTHRLEGLLADALHRAAVVVTFNSNTAVESVLAGRPTIAMDSGSMAWEVTSHSLTEPLVMPDRTHWAHRIAWKQWRIEEIRDGTAVAMVFASELKRSAA